MHVAGHIFDPSFVKKLINLKLSDLLTFLKFNHVFAELIAKQSSHSRYKRMNES